MNYITENSNPSILEIHCDYLQCIENSRVSGISAIGPVELLVLSCPPERQRAHTGQLAVLDSVPAHIEPVASQGCVCPSNMAPMGTTS